MGTGTESGTEARAVAEMGTGTRMERGRGWNGDWNEDGIGEGGEEVKKRKKPLKNCRQYVGNGRDLGGKKKNRQGRVESVAANPDNLADSKEAGGGAKGTQGLSKNRTSENNVPPLSRLIRCFRNKYS